MTGTGVSKAHATVYYLLCDFVYMYTKQKFVSIVPSAIARNVVTLDAGLLKWTIYGLRHVYLFTLYICFNTRRRSLRNGQLRPASCTYLSILTLYFPVADPA